MSAFGSRDSSVDWDDVDDVEEEGNDVGEEERLSMVTDSIRLAIF